MGGDGEGNEKNGCALRRHIVKRKSLLQHNELPSNLPVGSCKIFTIGALKYSIQDKDSSEETETGDNAKHKPI